MRSISMTASFWPVGFTYRWGVDIYASLLRPSEEYKTIDLPYAHNVWPQTHADHILKDGREVGISSLHGD